MKYSYQFNEITMCLWHLEITVITMTQLFMLRIYELQDCSEVPSYTTWQSRLAQWAKYYRPVLELKASCHRFQEPTNFLEPGQNETFYRPHIEKMFIFPIEEIILFRNSFPPSSYKMLLNNVFYFAFASFYLNAFPPIFLE